MALDVEVVVVMWRRDLFGPRVLVVVEILLASLVTDHTPVVPLGGKYERGDWGW